MDLSHAVAEIRDRNTLSEVATLWDCATTDFLSRAVPWRSFWWRDGQRHYSRTYWSATNRDHVIYKSRLELARLMLADYDTAVRHVIAQPFLLRAKVNRRIRRHVPDFLLFTDTVPTVVDVKPRHRLEVDKVRFTLDWTRALVEALGWRYEVCSDWPEVFLHNVRFLAGFRNPERFDPELLKAIDQQSSSDTTLGEVLDRNFGEPPWRVRAAVLHLVWRRALHVDISAPLSKASPSASATSPGRHRRSRTTRALRRRQSVLHRHRSRRSHEASPRRLTTTNQPARSRSRRSAPDPSPTQPPHDHHTTGPSRPARLAQVDRTGVHQCESSDYLGDAVNVVRTPGAQLPLRLPRKTPFRID